MSVGADTARDPTFVLLLLLFVLGVSFAIRIEDVYARPTVELEIDRVNPFGEEGVVVVDDIWRVGDL